MKIFCYKYWPLKGDNEAYLTISHNIRDIALPLHITIYKGFLRVRLFSLAFEIGEIRNCGSRTGN